MQKNFEAPALTVIGYAEEVVMGSGDGGGDVVLLGASDFEFEHDSL